MFEMNNKVRKLLDRKAVCLLSSPVTFDIVLQYICVIFMKYCLNQIISFHIIVDCILTNILNLLL